MILLNGFEIIPTVFPDKTSQIWKLDPRLLEAERYDIEWRFESEGEFMQLAQLAHLLASKAIRPKALKMPYLPYARQDKMVGNDETFALRSFSILLNALNFDRVILIDPHSRVAAEVIDRVHVQIPRPKIFEAYNAVKADCVCYPDAGAVEKYSEFLGLPFLFGRKSREQLTGMITHYSLEGDPAGKSVLIVDDICDGGMTFTLLAKALLAKGASAVDLYVSHGLFTKGVSCLRESGIQRIFTKEGEVP